MKSSLESGWLQQHCRRNSKPCARRGDSGGLLHKAQHRLTPNHKPQLMRAYVTEKPTLRMVCECTVDKHCWTTSPKPELGDQGVHYEQPLSLPLCESCGLKNCSPWDVRETEGDHLEAETRGLGHCPAAWDMPSWFVQHREDKLPNQYGSPPPCEGHQSWMP